MPLDELLADDRARARAAASAQARDACRRRAGSRDRTRHCPRTASSTMPARGPRGPSSTASPAGWRRRSTSSRWHWRFARGRRTAARGASDTASRRTRRRRRRTRTSGSRNCTPRTLAKSTRARSLTGSVSKKAMLLAFAREQRLLVGHVDRLDARLARADRRAGFDAETAAGAVLDVELQREARFRVAARVDRRRLEGGGRGGQAHPRGSSANE